ncbi:MAG: signal recognition particle-docking protein FtsY [Chlamydiales bacterium]|nr:signal recognition particle-docking protein FtsY [Chlamydiales bacterium]
MVLGFLKSSFQKVKSALSKTRSLLGGKIRALFGQPWDEKTFEELEAILYEADLGSVCVQEFVEHAKHFLRKNADAPKEELITSMRDLALKILEAPAKVTPQAPKAGEPLVILIVGVNGSGKTTSIAKLAKQFQVQNKKVLLGAGDTFRAAAIEQLTTWSERLGCEIVKSQPGSDPSAVAFDALTAAKARGADVVIIDTAGRLQNKTELMRELEKMRKVCAKVVSTAPHETLLVLDSTTGQNAVDQATVFHQFTPLTGIILAKLDGSAKGGIALSITKQLGIPIRWIGVGEKMEDLLPFDREAYANALFSIE